MMSLRGVAYDAARWFGAAVWRGGVARWSCAVKPSNRYACLSSFLSLRFVFCGAVGAAALRVLGHIVLVAAGQAVCVRMMLACTDCNDFQQVLQRKSRNRQIAHQAMAHQTMAHQPNLLLTNGTILDVEGKRQFKADILIRDGVIKKIGANLSQEGKSDEAAITEYDCTDRYISIGWMDMHVHLREPGFEHKETIATGCKAAAFGGFTAIACMPNTNPPIHTSDVVTFIKERSAATPVDVYPIACVSKERAGKDLAEMADLVEAGAVAFSDDGSPVQDSGLMRRALEYSSMLDRVVINHMEDLTLNGDGHMHEGVVATRLGVPGIPGLAEEVMIGRDALLAEYTGGGVHVAHISTRGAVEIVRRSKARGIPITAEVCAHHFTLTDQAVEDSNYATNTKMHPPLRTADDVEAMKEGLRDGTIDAIVTDHAPHASFEKEVEFTAAPFGIIGLETAWGLTGREIVAKGVLSLELAVEKVTIAPRRIMRIAIPKLAEGSPANLTIFDSTTEWIFEESDIKSKSHNTPFVGDTMVGKAWAIYNKGQFVS